MDITLKILRALLILTFSFVSGVFGFCLRQIQYTGKYDLLWVLILIVIFGGLAPWLAIELCINLRSRSGKKATHPEDEDGKENSEEKPRKMKS